jgi:hypothetical protein
MGEIMKLRPVLLAAAITALSSGSAPLRAENVYIEPSSAWRYLPGLAEASAPPDAWRLPNFDDSTWPTGAAPFGYGDPPYGTDLGRLAPPMQRNYTCIFLRREFHVPRAEAVVELHLRADYDDGFALWINGAEALRVNLPGAAGEPLPASGTASLNREPGTFQSFLLPAPRDFLVTGRNVIAVQAFNSTIANNDFTIDLELIDPLGPDLRPPAAALIVPAAGLTVRRLPLLEVTFSEAVAGVGAGDLLVNGRPAESVEGTGAGPYRFHLAPTPPGPVEASWAPGHGITDLAAEPNPFPGGSWSYTLDPAAPPPAVAISEFVAANRAGLRDDDGDPSDWIEIANLGAITIDLAGWSLTDDRDQPGKWTFPSIALPPGRQVVVFASGKDRRPANGTPLHASFSLNAAGEYLALFTPETPREPASEYDEYPEQRADHSYGLAPAGGLAYFAAPTPGAPNAGPLLAGFVAELRFSVERGFPAEPFDLEISTATPGAAIRYTLDGSEPAEDAGISYAGPLRVAGSARRAAVTLRAAAFKEGYLPSRVATHTYVFLAHVPSQPADPEGFPSTWGAAPSVDYAMDSEVAASPLYSGMLSEGLVAIPSVSIVANVDHLFGPSGLYANPLADGVAWERPASAEFIYPDGRQGHQIDCGMRIQGGASREPPKSPKHSFRLNFKGDYGPTKLRLPLFPGSRVDTFDTVHFRANFNNSWIHWSGAQRARADFIRDQWARDTQRAMGQPASHGTYVHVYLNGLYWGLYNLVERPNAPFVAAHLGGEKEDYDALNSAVPVDGDLVAWNELQRLAGQGLAADDRYLAIQEYLDVANLADYMILNLYGGNDDWPYHNWYAARRREPGAGYMFFSWDAERILEGIANNRTGVADTNSPAFLYSQLRANAEFRLHFADRVHRHFFHGGALTPEAAVARWQARADEIDRAVVAESARWGDYRRDVHPWSEGPYLVYTRNDHWLPEGVRLREQYFPQRSAVVLNQFRALGLYPSVAAPVFSQHGGPLTPGLTLEMTLPDGAAGTIHYTLDGSDPRQRLTGEVSPRALAYSGPVVLDDATRVKARTLGAGGWSALSEALFTDPEPIATLRITEILYHPSGGGDHEFLELVNTGARRVEIGGLRFTSGISFTFPPGAALEPGEYAVLASNREAFALRYPLVEIAGVFQGRLDNGGERLTLEDEAGNALASFDYDEDGGWPIGPDGFGYSLVLADPGGDPDDPRSWRASAQAGGSPGTADPPPVHGGVVISEVLPRAARPLEQAVELHNTTGRPVEIGGWYLSDRRDDASTLKRFRIPDGTAIPPGGHIVFYELDLNARPGTVESFRLEPRGGAVYLAAADSRDVLTGYIAGAEFPPAEEGVSFGRHLTSRRVDFTALAARTFGADHPTSLEEFRTGTGLANAPARVGPVVIHEIHYRPAVGDVEFLELRNLAGTDIALFDTALGRGWRLNGILDAMGAGDFEFGPGAVLAAGGLLVVVPIEPASFRALRALPPGVPVHGPYTGALDNAGERLELLRPEMIGAEVADVLVDHVRYNDRAPWPELVGDEGRSLERVLASSYGNDPVNWDASAVSGGTPGAPNSVSSPGAPPLASFTASPLSGPAPLEVRLDAADSRDPDGSIVSYLWSLGDGETASGVTVVHTFTLPGSYAVTLTVVDNEGAFGVLTRHVTALGAEEGGGQVPSDLTQDGRVDLSDAIALLGHLFLGTPASLPCRGGTLAGAGNAELLDADGSGNVNLTDAVHLLLHLFRGGAPPALGKSCVPIDGCPDACAP